MSENPNLLDTLTKREKEVLAYIAEGLTNRQIAEELVLSVDTVHWYTKQIYSKLQVNSRTQASLLAKEFGLLDFQFRKIQDRVESTLPVYTSSFVGREKELSYLSELIREKKSRLITILGSGGVGKTRLAIEVARRQHEYFREGIFFIPLDDNSTTYESFIETFQRYLRLPVSQDASNQAIYNAIRDQTMLLLFDNFEQSIDEREQIVKIMDTAPESIILTTSQISLGLQQEWLVHINGLTIQGSEDVISEASQLFAERVQRVKSDFTLEKNQECIQEICVLLEGMPLALELAANWMNTLSCNDMLIELRRNFDMLKTDAPDVEKHHRSIRAIFEHAWQLLSRQEQDVLRRLSVLRGEFGLAAARQVANASIETLAVLVDRSFILQTTNDLYRFHGLLRQYAEEKLHSRQDHGKHSNVAMAILALMKGEFEKVETLAANLMEESLDEINLDKGLGLALLGVIAGVNEDYEQCLQLCKSSLSVTQESPIAHLFSYLGMAIGYIGQSNYNSAWSAIVHTLKNAQSLHMTSLITLSLPIVALVKASESKLEEAVSIISVVLNQNTNLPQWMLCWKPFEHLQVNLEQELEPTLFESLWNDGKSLNPQVVCKEILGL